MAGSPCSSPRKTTASYADALSEGFGRPGARRTIDDFDVAAVVPVVINDDVEAAADMVRPMLALYAGGMGAKEANFHLDVFARMGYEGACIKIQDLYLAGDKRAAIARGPDRHGRGCGARRPEGQDRRRPGAVA